MKLEAIGASTVRLAVKLYLSLAYPGDLAKKARIPNPAGGGTAGADWATWDPGYQQALHQMFRPRAN